MFRQENQGRIYVTEKEGDQPYKLTDPIQRRIQGGAGPGAPPDQMFPNFMQFLGKIWQIGTLAPPPTRHPGLVPAISFIVMQFLFLALPPLLENWPQNDDPNSIRKKK